MKKINKPLSKDIPPIKLYIDDLDLIYQTFKKINEDIEITTEDYKVENVKQLKDIGLKSINSLTMSTNYYNNRIRFGPGSAEVTFRDDTLVNRGILSEIVDILDKRRIFLGRFLSSNWAFFLNGLLISLFFITAFFVFDTSHIYFGILLCLCFFSIITQILLYRFDFKKHSRILLVEKREEQSFWKRNKDQIIIALISALAAAILTTIGFLLFDH